MAKRHVKAALCIASLIGACALGNPLRAQEIVIGQSAPLTGPAADIGRDIRDGAQVVFDKVNAAGGIKGRPITLVTLDDANDKQRAADNAGKLLKERGALALFGFASATLATNAIPLAADVGAVVFAPFTGSLSIRDKPSVFTVRASYRDEAERIVAFEKSVGAQSAVVLHYDDEVGRVNYETVAAVLAGTGPKPPAVAIKRNATIDASVVEAIVKTQAQYVFATTQAGPVVSIIKALAEQGRTIPVVALSFVNPDELVALLGTEGRGTVVSQVVPSPRLATNPTYPVIRECADALTRAKKAKLNYTSLEACIAAKVLVEGLKRASPNPSRSTLLRALEGMDRYDAGGYTVTFSGTNHHGSHFVDLSILSRDKQFVH
jgi:ABC-type branched-subunit amino acid transport system substrate-binding protein